MYYNIVLLVFFPIIEGLQLNWHIFTVKMLKGLGVKGFDMWGQQHILIIKKNCNMVCYKLHLQQGIYLQENTIEDQKMASACTKYNQSNFLCFISQLNMEYDLIQVMVSLEQVFEFKESSNLACAFMSCLFVIIRTKRFLRYFSYKRIYP